MTRLRHLLDCASQSTDNSLIKECVMLAHQCVPGPSVCPGAHESEHLCPAGGSGGGGSAVEPLGHEAYLEEVSGGRGLRFMA